MEFRDAKDRIEDIRRDPDRALRLFDNARRQMLRYAKEFPPDAAELENWMVQLRKIAVEIKSFCPPTRA